MNSIRQVQALNKRELENGISPEGSWHADYRDTAFIYIGGLPFDLSEGDVIAIFSQYGEPVHINLVRDKDTGKSRGFAFLKYEDQRSTDLAVDNLGGATVLGRVLRVDHTRYKPREGEVIEDNTHPPGDGRGEDESPPKDGGTCERHQENDGGSEDGAHPMLPEEKELARLMNEDDNEDPMKEYLIKEKREAVEIAVAKYQKEKRRRKTVRGEHRHDDHHRRRHRERERSRHDDDDDEVDRRYSRRQISTSPSGGRSQERRLTNPGERKPKSHEGAKNRSHRRHAHDPLGRWPSPRSPRRSPTPDDACRPTAEATTVPRQRPRSRSERARWADEVQMEEKRRRYSGRDSDEGSIEDDHRARVSRDGWSKYESGGVQRRRRSRS